MKRVYLFISVLLLDISILAQAPLSFKYQAVLRDARGNTRSNTAASIGIDLLQGSTTGMTVYMESHNVTTDSFGLINIEIGKGSASVGSLSAVDWSTGPYYIKVIVDGLEMGTSQLLSVPYALYAKTAGNGFSGSYNDLAAKPQLFDGTWSSLTGRPAFAPVAISGSYNDLSSKPVIFSGAWASLTGKPTYAVVAATGSYNDLLNKPAIFDGTWLSLSGKPTTVSGFGIIDAVTTINNQIIGGNKSFTGFIASVDQSLSGKLGVSGNASIGTLTPEASAVLDVSSTSQGFLPPRMTYAQKISIVSPVAGLVIWCSNCGISGELQVYNGIIWTNLVGAQATASLPILSSTTAVSSITGTTVTSGGYLSNDGGDQVTARGVCWGTSENPTVLLSSSTTDGTGTGVFTSSITGLSSGTTYYLRSYATNSLGTTYGNQLTFNTTSATVDKIKYLKFESYYSADNGQINVYEIQAYENGINVALNKPVYANSFEYGDNITNGSRAVDNQEFSRWSSNRNDPGPDLANPHYIVVALRNLYSIDSIQLNIKGFDNWKQIFDFSVSSDSINWISIGKGDNISGIFTYFVNVENISIPSLATSTATSVGTTTATSGGIITGDGGATITSRGVCWSIENNPTTDLPTKTNDGTGSGSFASSISGLISGTTYYARAFATNSAGTAYGNETSFKTLEVISNKYLFRDTTSTGNLYTGYPANLISNTFSYDLWIKPTRSITMVGESNVCMGGISVPLANSNQNWAILAVNGGLGISVGVGLTVGTNGIMIGEHTGNLLVSRLSYAASIADWVHIAVVYRPDSIFLYLNGSLVRSRNAPCSSVTYASNCLTGSVYSPEFKGNIDEFRLWDIPLTRQDVLTVKDKKLMTPVSGLRYYVSFDEGTFVRTLGDIGNMNMTVTGLLPSKHIKTSSWNLVRYKGPTINALTPY